jgi:hypothetical protein
MADTRQRSKRDDFLNWSKREPAKAAKKAWEMCKKHEGNLGWRHLMALRGALAYSGAGLGDLFENLQFEHPMTGTGRSRRRKTRYSGFADRSQEQHARAICETVSEKLFGMDEPKTQLVATDAEWEVRRSGIWADRFIEGTYHLSQGSYQDFWDLARQAALLAYCSTGTAAIRTEPDFVTKRVRNQLRSTLNTFIDPADRGADKPLSYFDITWENPEYLCEDERFKGKDGQGRSKEDLIWRAAQVPKHMQQGAFDGATFGTPMVKVLTAWRLPFGEFKGRHAVFIGGDEGGESVLHWDDWEFPEPPIAFLRCNRAIGDDFWGENMIEVALDPLRDAEDIDDTAKVTMRRQSSTMLCLDGSSTAPAALLNAKDVNVCKYDSKKGEKKPEMDKPGILNGDYFDWQARKIALAHELTGVSLMHQAGEVQGAAGHRSGRSIRLEASMLPERFARKLRSWRNWVAVDCAKNHIRAAKLIGERDPDWQVTWPGADFDAKVPVKVLDIDMEAYTVRPYAVSEQKGTPAERADFAQELYDRGEIDDAQLTLILEGLYDTKKETKASTAERAYVSKVIDEMLHGEPELVANERIYMRDHYIPPDPWNDPDAMLAIASPRYTQAKIDKVPQNRRSLLRRFLEDIWALRQQKIREEKLQEASLNIAAQTADPLAMAAGGMPGAAPALPAPGAPAPLPPQLGAPPAATGIAGPALNAPGAPGLV